MIKKFFNKILNIIKGTYYNIFKKNNELAKYRLKICEQCPERMEIGKNGKTHICKQCGCILESKTRVESESCLLNKW